MLIDNKRDYSAIGQLSVNGIKTVLDFIRKYTSTASGRKGELDAVTGFFTIAGLNLLYKELSSENKYRLVLSELTGDDDFMSRVIDLLQGDAGICASLNLSQSAKNAVEFLKRETVEVRAITNAFCHAKAYVYKDDSDDTHDYYVMGSSNLTEAGLGMRPSANVELNFAQTGRTNNDYIELRKWFDEQWNTVAQAEIPLNPADRKSTKISVKQYFIDRIEECFGRVHSPEEIYYKILFELFGGDIDIDGDLESQREMTLLQDSTIYRTLFDYQKKGVVSLIKMLRKWNGAILADAVGLGKTFSALAVMKYFQNNGYETLLLCPKKLEQNWKQYRRKQGSRFDRDEFDYAVRFHTDLQDGRMEKDGETKLSWLLSQRKLLVVIDESHNLRNDSSQRYKMLLDSILRPSNDGVVRDIKVLLLSATPINNGLTDIRNQFKLIAKGDDSAFDNDEFGVNSLEQMFREANLRYREWCGIEGRTIKDFIDKLQPNFFSLTDKLIVARTRQMIETTLGESLGFPKKRKPVNEYAGLSSLGQYESIADVYDAMLKSNLTAYQPTQYMEAVQTSAKDKGWQDDTYREKYLVKMMAVLFMKRLESCWLSCFNTVEKVLRVHERTLAKVDAYLESRGAASIGIDSPDGEDGDEDEEDFTLRSKTIDLSKMARIDRFRADLEADVDALNDFYNNLAEFQEKFEAGEVRDEKLDRLVKILEDKQTKANKKALVFTTFGDTAKYIYEQIRKEHPEWNIACVTGQEILSPDELVIEKDKFRTTLQRFAPFSKLYKERDWHDLYTTAGLREEYYDQDNRVWNVPFDLWRETVAELDPKWQAVLDSEIDILIATDCLSEGQNLQDADLVINYDIHWNPVRLIQRFGRIDRIGSPNTEVGSVNFWPTSSYNDYLDLADRITNRMSVMVLAGTETLETTQDFSSIVKDNPLLARNTQRLLDQIANADISEIEDSGADGKSGSLGLQDFSLETFRQDLVGYLDKNRDFFRKMPAGVFSGFELAAGDFQDIPESLVAVLGYPRRSHIGVRKPYERLYLVLQPANGNISHWSELPVAAVLDLLRKTRKSPTVIPEWIAKGDATMIGKLSGVLKDWMKAKKPNVVLEELDDILSGQKKIQKGAAKIEDIFKPENFDLIAWEYISRASQEAKA